MADRKTKQQNKMQENGRQSTISLRKKEPRLRFLCVALAGLLLSCAAGCGRKMGKNEYRELGIEAMRAGDYEGAKQRFAEALDASNGEVSELQYDILKYRAECEIRLAQYDEALNTYTVLQQLDENEENQAVYAEVLGELSGLDTLRAALSDMEAGAYEAAYEKLDPIADLNSGMVGSAAWYNRAVCMENLQMFSEAQEAFSDYLERYPDDAAAQKELAFLKTR